MRILRLFFPHISRLFSASLWLMLLALIGINLSLWHSRPLAYSDKLINVFHQPLSWDPHVTLAKSLWQNGSKDQAIHELSLAQELTPVLGAETETSDMLVQWKNQPAQQKQQESYWQGVLTARPDYRDAYIQLASLSYQEGNLTQSHAYLLRAQLVDPNNSTVKQLVEFTSKLLE